MSLCSFYDGPDRVPLRLCTDISGYFRNSYVEHYLCPTLRRPYGEGKAASLVKRVETRNQMVETLDQKVELDYSARSEKTAVEHILIHCGFFEFCTTMG